MLHAIWMIILLFFSQLTDIGLQQEAKLLKIQSAIRNYTFIRRFYPPTFTPDDIIFLDVTEDKIAVTDISSGKRAYITNRQLLDSALQLLKANNSYRYILCDLGFEVSLPDDSITVGRFRYIPRIGFALNPEALPDDPEKRYQLPGGITTLTKFSNWWVFSGDVLKVRLAGSEKEKSLPLVMAEAIYGREYQNRRLFLKETRSGSILFKSVNIAPHIRPYQLLNNNGTSRIWSLTDFVSTMQNNTKEAADIILRNKIIVIGDYTQDMYTTVYGDMPGPLILLNGFISIAKGENVITIPWLLAMLFSFTFISYGIFYGVHNKLKWLIRKLTYIIQLLLLGKLTSALLISMLCLFFFSLISYFILDTGFDLIVLSIWVTVLVWILRQLKWRAYYFRNRQSNFRSNLHYLLNRFIPSKKKVKAA